jgi:hypothetical protein
VPDADIAPPDEGGKAVAVSLAPAAIARRSASSKDATASTGPKFSSRTSGVSELVPASTVGSKK